MTSSSSQSTPLPDAPSQDTRSARGTTLSIAGLIGWLSAVFLAIASPILDLAIPAELIIGMVVFSGLCSLLSVPSLLNENKQKDAGS